MVEEDRKKDGNRYKNLVRMLSSNFVDLEIIVKNLKFMIIPSDVCVHNHPHT